MTQMSSADPATTVRQLLALPAMRSATLLGGGRGAGERAVSVRLAAAGRDVDRYGEGSVVLLDGRLLTIDTYIIDFLLREMSERGACLLVVVSPQSEIGLASRRLADKFALPLAVLDGDLLLLADELREVVEAPVRQQASIIVEAAEAIGRVSAKRGLEGILEAVGLSLGAPASLVGLEGGVVVGAPLTRSLPDRDRLPVATISQDGSRARVIQPLTLIGGEPPSFWLIVDVEAPTPSWLLVAPTVCRLASSFLATRLIADRLERERDARFRLGILNAIIASTEHPDAGLVQEIGTLGWTMDGWCSAFHIRVSGYDEVAKTFTLTDEITRYLAHHDLSGPVIERPDGWTTWTVSTREPSTASYSALTTRARQAVQGFVAGWPGLRVHVGVGRPYQGIVGLRRSLAEAHEASTIAQASGGRTAVQHIDELGVERILFGWYTSEDFSEFARALLRPVREIDKEEDLIRTLEVYLDNESSATVTAGILGVHRNTVINRIAKVREILSTDLDDPDQRLALQLACRVVNVST